MNSGDISSGGQALGWGGGGDATALLGPVFVQLSAAALCPRSSTDPGHGWARDAGGSSNSVRAWACQPLAVALTVPTLLAVRSLMHHYWWGMTFLFQCLRSFFLRFILCRLCLIFSKKRTVQLFLAIFFNTSKCQRFFSHLSSPLTKLFHLCHSIINPW